MLAFQNAQCTCFWMASILVSEDRHDCSVLPDAGGQDQGGTQGCRQTPPRPSTQERPIWSLFQDVWQSQPL